MRVFYLDASKMPPTSDKKISKVPLLDLNAHHAPIEAELTEAISRVVKSQNFILGKEVEALEQWGAEYSQCRFALGVSSGTDALLLALMALEIGPGDEVITSPFSFFATAGVAARLGARPVLVDIDPVSFNIDPALVEAAITPRTKVILPVHLYGQMADMAPIMDVAVRHGVRVVEDAAQAIGSEYRDGRRAGSIGDIGCFSFFPSKNLGAFGDGGMVVTNDSHLADRMRMLRVHGAHPKYFHKFVGGNFRLDAIQAAVLNVKSKYLDGWTAARQNNAHRYSSMLGKVEMITTPVAVYAGSGVKHHHIYNQYVVRTQDRDALRAHLQTRGIGTEIYYPVPFHLQECFAYLGYKAGEFPHSEAASFESLAIPIYPELTAEMQGYVVDSIREWNATAVATTMTAR